MPHQFYFCFSQHSWWAIVHTRDWIVVQFAIWYLWQNHWKQICCLKIPKRKIYLRSHMQNKKKIHSLAPSRQLLGDLPVHSSHFIIFFHKQHRTQVIFRVITSKLLLKKKHTLCLWLRKGAEQPWEVFVWHLRHPPGCRRGGRRIILSGVTLSQCGPLVLNSGSLYLLHSSRGLIPASAEHRA